MRSRLALASIGLGGSALLFLGLRSMTPIAPAEAAPNVLPPATREDTPVLVELFTSEGCSSCPPADRVVSELARTQAVPGARMVVLAHHVDYWNDLGWPDPFSSAAATSRQRSYAALGGGSYTPQAVVDGRAQMVGSQQGGLEKAVLAASKVEHARIDLGVVVSPPARGVFDVVLEVGSLPRGASADAELVVAVVQDRARVAVGRGENAGRALDHVAIVRSVKTIGNAPREGITARSVVHVPAVLDAPNGSTFSIVAFVQERASRSVLGASEAHLAAR